MSVFKSALVIVLPLTIVAIIFWVAVALGQLLLIIPSLIIASGWALLGPTIIFERKSIVQSFGRSWKLTHGYKLHVWAVRFAVDSLSFAGVFLIVMTYGVWFSHTSGAVVQDGISTAGITGLLLINLCFYIYVGVQSVMISAIYLECTDLQGAWENAPLLERSKP